MQIFFGAALTVLVFGAIIVFARREFAPPPRPLNWYRPAAMLGILVISLIAPLPPSPIYKGAIAVGLLLMIGNDMLIIIPGTPPVLPIAGSLPVYFLYWMAFSSPLDWHIPSPFVLLAPLTGGLLYWYIAPRLAELKPWIIFYLVNMTLLLWMSIDLAAQMRTTWSFLALAGALLLALADVVRGVDVFRRPIDSGDVIAPMIRASGHLLVAWSVWAVWFM
jgi:hypothetical protein